MGFSIAKYVNLLDEKVREGIEKLENVEVDSDTFRVLVININNAYMTAREYENVLYKLEENKTEELARDSIE